MGKVKFHMKQKLEVAYLAYFQFSISERLVK